jgi:hypothetical protein
MRRRVLEDAVDGLLDEVVDDVATRAIESPVARPILTVLSLAPLAQASGRWPLIDG